MILHVIAALSVARLYWFAGRYLFPIFTDETDTYALMTIGVIVGITVGYLPEKPSRDDCFDYVDALRNDRSNK